MHRITVPFCQKNVPPDGSWGWMVCLAFALNNILVYPIVSGFGLIFQETFVQYGMSATSTSFIINAHQAFGMFFCIFNQSLLKTYGYRKLATAGSLLIFTGIVIISQATSTISLLISFSLMTSIGLSLMMGSFTYAINCYFEKHRNKAMYNTMLFTLIGSIFMPHIINALMIFYSTKWAITILAAISMHSFVATMLLRPIKWYQNPARPQIVIEELKEYEMQDMSKSIEHLRDDVDEYLDNKQTKKVLIKSSIEKSKSHSEINTLKPEPIIWWKSPSIEVNLSSSVDIFSENKPPVEVEIANEVPQETVEVIVEQKPSENAVKPLEKMTFKYQMEKVFSLTFLKDSVFLNIILGITIETSAEINFTILTPFMLSDLTLSMEQIANVLSLIYASELVYRFASPFIGDWCHKSARVMYLMSLGMLIFTRTTFYFASSYESLLIVAVGLGIAKGVRSVYIHDAVTKYVKTRRKIATANNIQLVTNSFGLILIGPILGQLRDEFGSYNISIVFMNILTGITILMWTAEYMINCLTKTNKTSK